MKNIKNGFLTVPVAILIAGVLIAAAIIFAVGYKNSPPSVANNDNVRDSGDAEAIKPVTSEDHILGDIKAPIKIVEFSDTECPFCKRFHVTMQDVMKEYDGKVAWVYRHFPLDAIHSRARKEAEATECAAELGGPLGSEASNEKFWAYIDRVFEITPANNGLDPQELPKIAEYVGLNKSEFEKCLDSGKYAQAVEDDYQDGIATGVQGTPHSIVITSNGKKFAISGAQPLDNVKKIIDLALQEK